MAFTTNVSTTTYKLSTQPRSPFLPFTPQHLNTLVSFTGKRRYNIKLWKTFTDCFNCLPVAAIVDEKILCMHGGLSPELLNMEQVKRIMRPTGECTFSLNLLRWCSVCI